jgi:hypothetical protein
MDDRNLLDHFVAFVQNGASLGENDESLKACVEIDDLGMIDIKPMENQEKLLITGLQPLARPIHLQNLAYLGLFLAIQQLEFVV